MIQAPATHMPSLEELYISTEVSTEVLRPSAPTRSFRKPAILVGLLAGVLTIAGCRPSLALEQGWSAPVVADSFMYVGTRSGAFLKLPIKDVSEAKPLSMDPKSNNDLFPTWQYPRAGTGGKQPTLGAMYGTAAFGNDHVYITQNRVERGRTVAGVLIALNRETGAEQWSVEEYRGEKFGRIFGSPLLESTPARSVLYVADDKGYLYAVDAREGRVLWGKKIAEKRFWSTPAISGDTLYIGSMDRRLYAIGTADGSVKWAFEAGGAIASRPLVVGQTVYFGAFDRKFYAVDINTRAQRWTAPGTGWFWNDPVHYAANNSVLVGSLGGILYALDAASGQEQWAFNAESPIRARAEIIGDMLYVLPRSGKIYILDGKTGERRKSGPTLDANVLASPEWAGGFLYVHDVRERLHKVAAPAA